MGLKGSLGWVSVRYVQASTGQDFSATHGGPGRGPAVHIARPPNEHDGQVAASSARDQNPRRADPHRETPKCEAQQTPMTSIAAVLTRVTRTPFILGVLMNTSTVRVVIPVLGAAVLSGGILAAGAAPATAAQPAAAPASVASTVVSPGQVTKYHLSKKQVRDIEKAKKFANTKKAKQIRFRESRHHYKARSGQYTGAWQFDSGTWKSNGGRQFSKDAYKAPKWAQDYVMWRTHKARGWQPWGG